MTIHRLNTPLTSEDVSKLRVGDIVYLSGIVITARDSAHRRMIEYYNAGKKLPVDLEGGVIYHCGPVVKKKNNHWEVIAAGPTTSARMELYEADVIEKYRVKMIIGKGGMGPRTVEACKKYKAVYTVFTGGAGALAANAIKEVVDVYWLDLGIPEALWVFRVEDFGPLLVVIDSYGNNLVSDVMSKAYSMRERILEELRREFKVIE